MEIIVCNHCGKAIPKTYKRFLGLIEIEKYWHLSISSDIEGIDDYQYKKFDLCYECYKKLMTFVEPNDKED